jgi:hypothetical protein
MEWEIRTIFGFGWKAAGRYHFRDVGINGKIILKCISKSKVASYVDWLDLKNTVFWDVTPCGSCKN